MVPEFIVEQVNGERALESGVFVGCENTEMTFFFSFYEFHD
jgi:hypothetical protein